MMTLSMNNEMLIKARTIIVHLGKSFSILIQKVFVIKKNMNSV